MGNYHHVLINHMFQGHLSLLIHLLQIRFPELLKSSGHFLLAKAAGWLYGCHNVEKKQKKTENTEKRDTDQPAALAAN